MESKTITYYQLGEVGSKAELVKQIEGAVADMTTRMEKKPIRKKSMEESNLDFLRVVFGSEKIAKLLVQISRVDVFSNDFANMLVDDLDMLAVLKKLKYSLNLPLGMLVNLIGELARKFGSDSGMVRRETLCVSEPSSELSAFEIAQQILMRDKDSGLAFKLFKDFVKQEGKLNVAESTFPAAVQSLYTENAEALEKIDPHAVYPTSIYRRCNGLTLATSEGQTIEAIMETSLTTTIKITQDVLDPTKNNHLSDIYTPLGRCVAVVDDKVDELGYSDKLRKYFGHHGVELTTLTFGGNEIDKDMHNVEAILVALKKANVSRNEPVLIVGGGVLADIGGFACALYHRNTPYVMLSTSIVSGIDAGPSPRTCCDGFGYKNLYGAYHPPILTLTDRSFWGTLRKGWVRHGIAEIIKMSVVKDLKLFELLEKAGPKLVETQFGTTPESQDDEEFMKMCDDIVGLAMLGYVRSEYGNLWETHQCRPHAYGHTWSPGYELPAGMLHGHAVATCMGFGAYLSCRKMQWIPESQMMRILNVISSMELALWHPIMDDHETIYGSQKKMTDKRGGNLAAPVPKGTIGECGYINDMEESELSFRLDEYKALVERHFPGERGTGVEVHCADVGLQDPSTVIPAPDAKPAAQEEKVEGLSYQDWIATVQTQRNEDWVKNVVDAVPDTESPPEFPENSLFVSETVENYAMQNTTVASEAIQSIAKVTSEEKLFSPCMVGSLEAQFLKMIVSMVGAKRVLDVGTFTGMSAMAMAEGMGGGEVVTLEFDEKIAQVALKNFTAGGYSVEVHGMEGQKDKAAEGKNAAKMTLHVRSATEVMEELQKRSEKFDVIFLDADKENYSAYYKLCMDGPSPLLAEGGAILADNSLCALLYDAGDERRERLHEFNQLVKNDPRVEQVMLTIREGITMIKRKSPAFAPAPRT